MDCKYHTILSKLNECLWDRINSRYDWELFWYWLGDESALASRYKNIFEEVLNITLSDEQSTIVRKLGYNMEHMIGVWSQKWHIKHPELQNQEMPKFCLKQKMHEFLIYQLNKKKIRSIIDDYCC